MENNLPSTKNRTRTETENSDHLPDLGEGDELGKHNDEREANSVQGGKAGNRNINGGDEDMIILDQENDSDEAAGQSRVSNTDGGGEEDSVVNKGEVTVPGMEDDVWDGFEDGGGEVIRMDSPGRMDDSITIQVWQLVLGKDCSGVN